MNISPIPFLPRLEDNPWLVALTLLFFVFNIIAWRPGGLYRLQTQMIKDTRNTRTFSDRSISTFSPLRPVLLFQLFLFSGLSLFCATVHEAATHFAAPDALDWQHLYLMIGLPIVWFVLQWAAFNWAHYLFGCDDRIRILNRIYWATHLLASPLALVLFVLVLAGHLSPFCTLVLLSALFIFTQLTFIFSGFKIFLDSLGSLCFIIVYLCALEIAPLLIIWQMV